MLGDERMIKEDTESMAILTAGNCTLKEKFKVELEVEKLLHAVEVARWARKGKGSQVCCAGGLILIKKNLVRLEPRKG